MNADRTAPANATVRDSECPPATPYACDPSIEGIDEELEMRFFETQSYRPRGHDCRFSYASAEDVCVAG